MVQMKATMMHGKHDGEGKYTFDMGDAVLEKSPVRIMRAFMEYIDEHSHLGHLDYEINAAMKNREENVVTVIGEINFSESNRQPFMCMIAPA